MVKGIHYMNVFMRVYRENSMALETACTVKATTDPSKCCDAYSDNVDNYRVSEKENSPCNSKRKQVRFHEESNQVHDTLPNDGQEVDFQDVWYTVSEMRRFKKDASRLAKDIYRAERANHTDAFSFRQVFLTAYNACQDSPVGATEPSNLSDYQRDCLAMWMGIAQDRWGLERPIVNEIYHDKSYRKKELVRVVLELQNMSSSLGVQVRADYLRTACIAVSRPSQMFARLLAEAQAESLRSD